MFAHVFVLLTPYNSHTSLTDNGIQFTHSVRHTYAVMHILDHVCHEHGIEHRLTRANQPWTNGQVERVNRTVKEATVKQYHDQTAQQLQSHIHDFLAVYSFAKRLKALTGKTLMNISAMSRGKHQLS